MAAQLDQPAAVRTPDMDGLLAWAERTGHHRAVVPGGGGLRFAFYGRVSTEDWQDPVHPPDDLGGNHQSQLRAADGSPLIGAHCELARECESRGIRIHDSERCLNEHLQNTLPASSRLRGRCWACSTSVAPRPRQHNQAAARSRNWEGR
jgi:hypothetical protein